MNIGGIIDISTKDIPGKVSIVIFITGCNFKCEFCHNKKLLGFNSGKDYRLEQIISRINNNSLVNSVSITGGEPTLQADIVEICKEINKLGKYLSIDTNGSLPNVVNNLIPFLNRAALDMKAPFKQEVLERVIGVNIDPSIIMKTFDLLNNSDTIDFEVRTTYVENLLTPNDLFEIMEMLIKKDFRGNYVIQQYQYSNGVGDNFKDKFQKPEHDSLIKLINPYRNLDLPFKLFIRDDKIGQIYLNE